MRYYKPFNKKEQRVFESLMIRQVLPTSDIHLTRSFGRHYPDIDSFITIAHSPRKRQSFFIRDEFVRIKPRKNGSYEFFKIF